MSPRLGVRLLLGLALVVQLGVLYSPQGAGEPPFANADKLVHLAVFLVPTVLGLLSQLPVRWVVGGLAAHAVVSEVVQGVLLPKRSGDPVDAVADLAGILLGALAVAAVRRRR